MLKKFKVLQVQEFKSPQVEKLNGFELIYFVLISPCADDAIMCLASQKYEGTLFL